MMRDKSYWKAGILILLSFTALGAMLVSIHKGAVAISLQETWSYLFFLNQEGEMRDIILNIRLPRTLVAALVGANLAVSGAMLQGLCVTRSPILTLSVYRAVRGYSE